MYVETYEKSSKSTLFSNMRFIAMFITAICVIFLIKLRAEGSIERLCTVKILALET